MLVEYSGESARFSSMDMNNRVFDVCQKVAVVG